ncbi:dihydroorotate dehydrogenase electron transfer subunit [Aureibacillus halotolerans]|uniref:Dihydroorotate dehydrogenase B (NAD(+)), electron transfer subunit n=1 Tax=Aureibacillus halotolerans TaxID=1508390 RepID=A0A4R6UGT8_9BACI|nr:dihydroorotate dehydrogenase electron transfer subunit [Aureibacillus halotolerans]TDQ42354.1 dihydroorotate oxidase B electron transfer subunit [Aureibacillus halotolerans]
MSIQKQLLTLVQQNEIAANVYEAVLEGELVSQMTSPGQFIHVKVQEGSVPLLRRPISLCDVDLASQRLTIIYRAQGAGTKALAALQPGAKVDVLGPLGQGFDPEMKSNASALLIGGGVGVPPMYYLSKELTKRGVKVSHILGFDSARSVFYEEAFATLGPTTVTTVDGSRGQKGFVTDALSHYGKPDRVYACGPLPMLRALEVACQDDELYVSLEERMGCGVGACLACVCRTNESDTAYKKICTDGPVFRAGEVVL